MQSTFAAGALAALVFGVQTADAQSQTTLIAANVASDQIAEVIVTAQRRDQSLIDVPVALTVIGAEVIEAMGIGSAADLVALAPGLTGKPQGLATPVFAIRGISTNTLGIAGESSVGVFYDDTYLGRLESSNLPFFDVEQIEVLKGPQSTLFGRNASAGVISVRSRRPSDEFSGRFIASYGSYEQMKLEAAVDAPIAQSFLTRLAVLHRYDQGTEENVLLGRNFAGGESTAVRLILDATPSDNVRALLYLNYVRDDGDGFPSETLDPGLAALGGLAPDPYEGRHAMDAETYERRRIGTANLQLTIDLTDAWTLRSLTTATRTTFERQFDVDGSVAPFFAAHFRDYVSETRAQEFRLQFERGKLEGFFGASASRETIRQAVDGTYADQSLLANVAFPADFFFPGQPAFAACDEPSTSAVLGVACDPAARETIGAAGAYYTYAIAGDVTWRATEQLSLTIGGRLSLDEKRFDYDVSDASSVTSILQGGNVFFGATDGTRRFEDHWTSLQPRLVVDYKVDDGLVYASAAKGFKAGGFDAAVDATRVAFADETVWAYELGYRRLGRVISFSSAAYYQDYEGYQVQVLRAGVTSTLNSPAVESYGLEADVNWRPTDGITLYASAAWNLAEFRDLTTDNGDLSGNRLLYAPEFTAYGSVTARLIQQSRWQVEVMAAVRHESEQFYTIDNLPQESENGNTLMDAALTLDLVPFDLRVFARNLFDEDYLIYSVDQGFGVVANRGAPRVLGIEISAEF